MMTSLVDLAPSWCVSFVSVLIFSCYLGKKNHGGQQGQLSKGSGRDLLWPIPTLART